MYKSFYSGGNELSSKDILLLTNTDLQTLICHNNQFDYRVLVGLPFAKTLKKLSIGKNCRDYDKRELEKISMGLIADSFPNLSHLKLKGFKKILPEYTQLMDRLICLTVIESQAYDIENGRKYCKAHGIYFNENSE